MSPDITKCMNEECPKKEKCFRYTSKSDEMQSFFVDVKPNEKGECEYYWESVSSSNNKL